MKPPIDVDDLPPLLVQAVRAAEEEGLWGDAIDAFDDWLDERPERPPVVLVMLAFMKYRDALEVMVDAVTEHGQAALELLDEAKLDTKQIRALRAQIKRSIKHDQAHATQVERFKDRPLETLERSALRDLAYKLGESKEPTDQATAARAWVIAAGHESEAVEKNDCLARAALHFADAGDWTEAKPRLEEIVRRPRDYADWIPDYAWYRLLDKAIADDDGPGFRALWTRALAMERKDHFPYSNPAQAAFLAFAVKHRLADIAKHIVAVVMEHRSPRTRKPLAALLDSARALID